MKRLLLLVLMAATACYPITVGGDSITQQSQSYTSDPWWGQVNDSWEPGWDIPHARYDMIAKGTDNPDILVSALGQNDAGSWAYNDGCFCMGDGWSWADVGNFADWYADYFTARPLGCLVVVLPQSLPSVNDTFPGHYERLQQARQDITLLTSAYARAVIVDWGDVIDDHPEYIDAGGIHLSGTPGAQAYLDLVRNGTQACP